MSLRQLIDARIARVGIIGLGYVGLPLLSVFHRAGFPVVGFDIDPEKVAMLKAGETYLRHLGPRFVADMLASGPERFDATTDIRRTGECDAVLICVPTPLGPHLEPDLSYVRQTAEQVAETLRPGQLVVLESTTYPRTTREVVLPPMQRRGLACGRDYFLAYSPEREDPGRREHTTRTIPKLVGGIDDASTAMAAALYRQAIETVIEVESAEIAEAAKLLENIYRAVNIALVNEMKVVLTAMGIDIWKVIAAAATKPFGFQAFYPGPGLGGHCIPIDPFYLTWKAREYGQSTRFIELAGEINHAMPRFVIERLMLALNERGRSVRFSRVLVLGLAYKPDIDDVRESPSFELIERLRELGAEVDYNDPHVPRTHRMRRYGDLGLQSVELTPQTLSGYDAVVVATNHSSYDWQLIADHARLIIDTRNALRNVTGRREHIVLA
ncbi:MAG: nucleotide sugar dehydrogenase [Tepidisphaerales bacterium]